MPFETQKYTKKRETLDKSFWFFLSLYYNTYIVCVMAKEVVNNAESILTSSKCSSSIH